MLSSENINIVKSTAPVLEQHGVAITKCFYVNLFNNHPELLNIFNNANQRNGKQQTALANAVYAAAANIDRLEIILPVVKQIAFKHRSLGVKPEHYPIVGENLLNAIKEVLGDAATPEIMNAWKEAYGVIAGVFISIEEEMYFEAEKQSGGWKDYRNFVVKRKVKESDVITSFYLVPEDGGSIAGFKPGQYVSVKLDIPGEEYKHIRQYSLSDTSGKDYYRISVKREDAIQDRVAGLVSNFIHSHIQEGSKLALSAPSGEFVLDTERDSPVVLLSGGVGITPMISMLKSAIEKQPVREVTFIHAAINGTHHALRGEVEDSVSKNPNANAYFAYERPTEEDLQAECFHVKGYVDSDALHKLVINKDADYYICGPLPFMKAIFGILKDWNIPLDKTHYEVFGPSESLEN